MFLLRPRPSLVPFRRCLHLASALCLLLGSARPSHAALTQKVAAWGDNLFGQLGNGTSDIDRHSVPISITGGVLTNKTVTQITNGSSHTVALCSDGTLAAWGYNAQGQLGNGTNTSSDIPVAVTLGPLAGKTITQILAGDSHTLALCSDGTLAAWGLGDAGQLGTGNDNNSNVPVNITGNGALAGKTVTKIAVGYYHNMALCSDGTLAVWGSNGNGNGQLGNGSSADSNLPVSINGSGVLAGKTVTQMAGGAYFSLALCSDGTLAAWGQDLNNQLGTPGYTPSTVPINITGNGVLAGKTISKIFAGSGFSFALCSDGSLAGWGDNFSGSVGTGDNEVAPVPRAVAAGALAGKTITDINAGDGHTLALCSDGTVAAWGYNGNGQVGNSNFQNYTPTAVASGVLAGKTILGISAGGNNSFALYQADTVAPSAAYTTPSANAKISLPTFGAGNISGTASDDTGVASVKVRLSRKRDNGNEFWNGTDWISDSLTFINASVTGAGTPNATWSLNANVPPVNKLDAGLYGVRVYAVDTFDTLSAPADRFFTLYTDITVPTVTINSPTQNQIINVGDFNTSSLSGTASDNVGLVQVQLKLQRKVGTTTYYWNGSDFTTTVAKFDATLTNAGGNSVAWQLASTIPADKLTQGGYTLYATAIDAAGNTKTSPSRIFAIRIPKTTSAPDQTVSSADGS